MKDTQIQEILTCRNLCPSHQLPSVMKQIATMDAPLKVALCHWLDTDEIASPTYEGYDIQKVQDMRPTLTILGAYLMLEWIRNDAKNALKMLHQITVKHTPNTK